MLINWNELKISQAEIDNIFELNIISSWAIALGKVFLLRQTEARQSLALMESSVLFLSLVFLFPLNLIIFRQLNLLNSNSSGLILVLACSISLSILLSIAFNYYLWQKAKKLKVLSKLLTKVAEHNRLIDNFQLLSDILQFKNCSQVNNQRSIIDLQTVFQLTKDSLIKGIELESLIHHRQTKPTNLSVYTLDRDRLLADLENNLINLSLPETNSDREYRELLNEAVDIGLSIHQEMSKIQISSRL